MGRSAPRIAFLGTGIMGAPMCRRLLAADYPVTAWNRTAAKARALVPCGATAAATAGDALAEADVVIVMLSSGPVVREVLLETGADEAAADRLAPGSIVVVMSSIPVDTMRDLAANLLARGVHCVDAPVSGGEAGAIDGSLSIMTGGTVADLERVREVLERLGRVTHVGAVGTGQLAKLANQVIVGLTIDAVAEALLLADAGGADLNAVQAALAGGFADSTILRVHGRRMIDGDFEPGGRVALQLKDLETARTLANSLGLRLPALELVEQLYRDYSASGGGDLDHSAIFLHLQRGIA